MSKNATTLRNERHTDLGNSKRLVVAYGRDLRYVPEWGKWLFWDGARWQMDQSQVQVMEAAKGTIRAIYPLAPSIADDVKRAGLVGHARKSEQGPRLREMVRLAASDAKIVARPQQLDRDPWLLNCENGTIDLRTGELRGHSREDLITRLAPVVFDPSASSGLWDDFLQRATNGDQELQDYLQRVAGYTMVGVAREEVALILLGGTATGKSTFVEALKATLGEYAATADFETFLRRSQPQGPRTDLARLKGVRLVTASEVPAGRQFDESTVKQLTGGDTVTARHLYKEAFEYVPQFTICMAANHRPGVRDDDPAIWRRLKVISFEAQIPVEERDPQVKARLRDPKVGGPAILAWAVEGALKWQQEGLGEPEAVRRATQDYRSEMEIFTQFVEDCCVEDPSQWVESIDIRGFYENWCELQGNRYPYGLKRFANALRGRGHQPQKRGGHRGWRGIGIAPRVA